MATPLPKCVDTVVIGNGPSALILSYILHGHIPYYSGGHHDPILDQKLAGQPDVLHVSPDLYAHFTSSLRYSTQALPINTLLDTLIRPNADTEINPKPCIEWRYEPEKAVSHIAVGETPQPGGQWAENPVSASPDIGTLSYAEMLSLPGYSYADHLAKVGAEEGYEFVRPSRTEVASYLEAYPSAVGIADAIYTATRVDNVYRTSDGFMLGSLGVQCKHLVLASGIFTVNIPPPSLLSPLVHLDSRDLPLLVIGSGFSAADVIISSPPTRKVIHVFNWAPDTRPSPLRGCHHTAYPEYATIYRQMKLAAAPLPKAMAARSPMLRRKSNPFFSRRDWASQYVGLPNAEILSVSNSPGTASATVTIRLSSGDVSTYLVGGLEYVVGRRGTLDYLSPDLRSEVLEHDSPTTFKDSPLISGRTLRSKAEASLEVASNVFIIGSLAGDSLIRHAVGGCVFAAGRILGAIPPTPSTTCSGSLASSSPQLSSPVISGSENGASTSLGTSDNSTPLTLPDGYQDHQDHQDLHLDRRKITRAVDVANAENRYWRESGWWAGGLGPNRWEA